ncbi:uncharacterized protein [Temnothorax nylanderi]|uniref:uncharacterized protein n=1 Tax=Temnothorax nylanderi TaxID=102681 RepID=UPI003A8C355D
MSDEPSNMAERPSRCRICLADHGCMTSLLSDRVEGKLKDLIKCTCIDIKYEENLPGVVCHVCLYKLDMWGEFKERFVQSNKALLEQLEVSETSDNAIKDPASKDESCTTKNAKRKRKIGEDNISDAEKKKSRIDTANGTCDTDQVIIDTICISSEDNEDEPDSSKPKKNDENHAEGKTYSGPTRARLLPARRGRNIERRKASTKRWVERKKAQLALLAATGENVSDTDSIASDDVQLSPVQKARAKTNADKETERQKKVAKVLKNLETNLTEKYIGIRDGDTDSDARRTRLSKELHLQQKNKISLLNKISKENPVERNGSSLDTSMEREHSPTSLTDNVVLSVRTRKSKIHKNDGQTFTPQSLKSELVIGDTKFAVTSTLILVDPSNLNSLDVNNLPKDSKNPSPDESNREKNTDIIDAVQLRRVNPVTTNANNKSNSKSKNKLVERCLNIEVEGHELMVLKRVQCELADFVEKEMKHKLLGTSDGVAKTDNSKINSATCTRTKLDQKLKDIIELAIKKNIEPSTIRQMTDVCSQGSTRFSPALVKMAMNSPRYQPKLIIKRLDIAKESKHYNVNNSHVIKSTARRGRGRGRIAGPFSISRITRKRQSVPPVRYNDYNVSALDSDSDASNDNDRAAICETPKATNSILKRTSMMTRQSAINIDKPMENKQDKQTVEETNKVEGAITETHMCGLCGLTFQTRKEVDVHILNHKAASDISTVQVELQNDQQATSPPQKPRQGKQKMMRCKRCHEIVEARLVKTHVCKTSQHKCYVCNSIFRTKNLLAKHLEGHDHSEFNIENAIGNKKLSSADTLLKMLSVASTSPQKDQVEENETATKTQTVVSEKNDIQSDKISSTGVKLDSTENIAKKPKETYTCFVCDKIFTDEEILKDHLQKHCDDLSEGEQSNSKEQYQCGICSKILESDEALEEHVGKHLFDDEDDNPNLISIDQSTNDGNNKSKETEAYQCGQCSATFDSEMLLEMHMQEHEEEVAIAEWEKQGMKVHQYQCMLCDELFNAEKELAEHLDIHNANAHVCMLCDKPFRTLEDLQEHVATH